MLPLLITFLIFLSSLNLSLSTELCNPNDKKVLLNIQTQDFGGLDLWDPKTDCCKDWSNWPAIVKCDVNGHVTELSISGILVNGEIPPSIGDLTFLQSLTIALHVELTGSIPISFTKLVNLKYLDLHINNLTGPIPDFLGRMKALTYIDFTNNAFSGPIPSSLAQLPNLQNLILQNNQLTGPIPGFLTRMSSLTEITIGGNNFKGTISPAFSNLPNLAVLDLAQSGLTGSIPDSFGSFKNPNLKLRLSANRLSGPIPRSLGRANMSGIILALNKFTGDASFLFGKDKTMLREIDIAFNHFEFNLSNVDLPQGIKVLDISRNKIYGSLPKRLGQLPLQTLDVSHNRLCGMIPTGRRLKRFSPDSFSHNKCLCGPPLPPCKQ